VVAVIMVHWCGIYWGAREAVASYIHAPVIEGPPSSMSRWLDIPTFNYGPFGVSIFFLISGFVIPFSLARTAPLKFLVARFLRIYPTYIVASFTMLLLVYLSSRYWGQSYTLSLSNLVANLTLVQENLSIPSIDLVNWTLSIEIKFYLVAALLYMAIRKGNPLPIIFYAVLVLAFCSVPTSLWPPGLTSVISIDSLKTELMYTVFMFVGTGFYHHYTGDHSGRQLFQYCAVLLVIFMLCWPRTSWVGPTSDVPQNYMYGLLTFGVSYLFRDKFRPIWPLDFLANISYSVYVLHSIIGYLSIRILMDQGCTFPVAGLLTLIFVLVLAYGLHVLVERPTMHMGKNLFKTKVAPPDAIATVAQP